MATAHRRAASVFCSGPLLDAVQCARFFPDAKHFVDMPLRTDPEEVLAAFARLPAAARADPARLRAFVDEFFLPPGADLEPYLPKEASLEPPFVTAGLVRDVKLQEFAVALHQFWPALCRVTVPAVATAPQRFTTLPRKHPVVLPGGRFRETYYWDSLWIVQGLLASGMVTLAKGLTQNLLDDVADFGFVPNGGRCYYLNRSQPPLLAAMVAEVAHALDAEEEQEWLAQALPLLVREYDWWMHGDRTVSVDGGKLNRFRADWDTPRPESYWEDVHSAKGSAELCRELASAAETGWDFSSRWGRPAGGGGGGGRPFHVDQTRTTAVLPVCLNAILYRVELTLADISRAVATGRPLAEVEASPRESVPSPFLEAARARRAAMDAFLWRPDLGRWVDAWLPEQAAREGRCSGQALREAAGGEGARPPTVADFAHPLWAGLASPEQAAACVAAVGSSGLIGPAGVMTTAQRTGEQWDAPNAWAPMQAMLIEGLQASGVPEGERLAAELAQRWVGTCYAAWQETGAMHEKYDALQFGKRAGGGEYEPQEGFGWTNGVVLRLLAAYGRELAAPARAAKGWSAPCKVGEPAEADEVTAVPSGLLVAGGGPHQKNPEEDLILPGVVPDMACPVKPCQGQPVELENYLSANHLVVHPFWEAAGAAQHRLAQCPQEGAVH